MLHCAYLASGIVSGLARLGGESLHLICHDAETFTRAARARRLDGSIECKKIGSPLHSFIALAGVLVSLEGAHRCTALQKPTSEAAKSSRSASPRWPLSSAKICISAKKPMTPIRGMTL